MISTTGFHWIHSIVKDSYRRGYRLLVTPLTRFIIHMIWVESTVIHAGGVAGGVHPRASAHASSSRVLLFFGHIYAIAKQVQ